MAASELLLKVAKVTPFIGLALGIGFGAYKFTQGKWVLGCAELTSGAVSMVPVYGTAAGLYISAGITSYEIGQAL